jgi:glycosyltransferase involved in cell wall biosynthesis
LHVFPSFAVGGSQTRFGQLVAAHGERYRHTVISLDGRLDMVARLPSASPVISSGCTGAGGGLLTPVIQARRKLAELQPDVLVTYNWGSMNWWLANRWMPVTSHVHIEDGFGPEEQSIQLRRRVLARRLLLSGPQTTVVVPSMRLLEIATDIWKLPRDKIQFIPNGVQTHRFEQAVRPRPGEDVVVGTVATLRPEKNLGRLIRLFAAVASDCASVRLMIVGDGPLRASLEDIARETAVADRITFCGPTTRPEDFLAKMDIFALSSDTEQMPLSVLEAMSSALPVVSFDVGDVKNTVSGTNLRFAAIAREDDKGYIDALRALISSKELRLDIGTENRRTASARFSHTEMVDRYAELFG